VPSKSSASSSRGGRRSSQHAPAKERPKGLGRPQWSGTLSFGLVSIPVELYSGTRSGGVSLRLLAPDGVPLSRRFFCPEHDEPVDNDKLVRGYEHARGEYVVVTDEELEGLAPDKSRDIDLRSFAPVSELDPVYFDRSFFLLPAGTSSKAYQLLASVMEDSERAGIATFVMRDKEYLVAILAQDGLLIAQTLRFPDQVRSTDALDLPEAKRVPASAVEAFTKVIRKHARDEVDLERLHNDGADALRKLAEKKAKTKKNVVHAKTDEDTATDAEIIDLMDILQRSLQDKDKQGATKLKGTLTQSRRKSS
jgi:DNA end-binding protein Ku